MADSYDDKIETMIVTRRRMTEQRLRARQRELQKQIGFIIGGIAVVILLLVMLFKGCSSDDVASTKKPETTKPVGTFAVETTTPPTEVSDDETGDDETVTVEYMYTTDTLNFRKKASTDAEIILQIPAGGKVKIISDDGDWCKISYKKKKGFVKKEYLSESKPE